MPSTRPILFENDDGEYVEIHDREVEEEVQEGEAEENQMSSENQEASHNQGYEEGDSVTATFDPKVFNCTICSLPLTIPVFQCDEGHLACASCLNIMMEKVCPSCSLPVGYKRCGAIEKFLESMKIPCSNKRYGCKSTISYTMQHEHDLMCIHQPFSCPDDDCHFVASAKLLYAHYSVNHSPSSILFQYNTNFRVPVNMGKQFLVLQETYEKTIFLLNYGAVLGIGYLVNITCIAPSMMNKAFRYSLLAEKGQNCVRLESFAEAGPRSTENIYQKTFLLVPSEFLDSYGEHYLQVRIWRTVVSRLHDSTLPGPDITQDEAGPPLQRTEERAEVQPATRPPRVSRIRNTPRYLDDYVA